MPNSYIDISLSEAGVLFNFNYFSLKSGLYKKDLVDELVLPLLKESNFPDSLLYESSLLLGNFLSGSTDVILFSKDIISVMSHLSKNITDVIFSFGVLYPRSSSVMYYAFFDGMAFKATGSVGDLPPHYVAFYSLSDKMITLRDTVDAKEYSYTGDEGYCCPLVGVMAYEADTLGVGLNGKMSWNIPEEIEQFLNIISNSNGIIVGYNTFEKLPKYFISQFSNSLYIYEDKKLKALDGTIFDSVDEFITNRSAIKGFSDDGRAIYVIGGPKTISAFSEYINEYILTEVRYGKSLKKSFDSFFPYELLDKIKKMDHVEISSMFTEEYSFITTYYSGDK